MTRRQEIVELLEKQPLSAHGLANKFGVHLKVILEDLYHIKKSLKGIRKKLRITPAHCKKCHFVFKEKERIRTPSKCPQCRSEWIEREKFLVE